MNINLKTLRQLKKFNFKRDLFIDVLLVIKMTKFRWKYWWFVFTFRI